MFLILELLDGPSLVYVNVFVRSFSKIDDVKMVRASLDYIYTFSTGTLQRFPKYICVEISFIFYYSVSPGVQFPSDPTSAME